MPSSSFTFNSNNNYQVDRVNEPDVDNPSVFKYTSTSSTPFVEIKITPTNPQTNPVLASNLKFDDLIPYFQWAGAGQSPQTCAPSPTPHGAISSLQHVNSLVVPSTCINGPLGFGFSNSFGSSNEAWQGPYHVINDPTAKAAQIQSLGVAWKEVVLIEVYEDDNGILINDNLSPELEEQFMSWTMWIDDSNFFNLATNPITTNVYPKYVKAFVYLEFGTSGLFSNTILNIDIDEVEPTYGCIDPTATNHDASATVDDGSCIYPPPQYSITFNGPNGNATGPYSSIFTSSPFAIGNPGNIRNFRFNGGVPLTLSNTYEAGEYVGAVVTIDLTPVVPNFSFNAFEAVYDFPITNPNGGPDFNLDLTDATIGFGDSMNNLTAASVRFLNLDNYNSLSQTPNYLNIGDPGFVSGISSQPSWVADGWNDLTGAMPSTIVYFGDGIDTVDDNNNPISLQTDGIQLEEFYYASSNPQLILNPGYEWYPYKLTLSMQLDFYMPAHNLNVVLELDHNTENQGGYI